MIDLIDREEAYKELIKRQQLAYGIAIADMGNAEEVLGKVHFSDDFAVEVDDIAIALHSCKTVIVRRGNWECVNEPENVYMCSACGGCFTVIEGTPYENNMNYCPVCGAKMDEVSE